MIILIGFVMFGATMLVVMGPPAAPAFYYEPPVTFDPIEYLSQSMSPALLLLLSS